MLVPDLIWISLQNGELKLIDTDPIGLDFNNDGKADAVCEASDPVNDEMTYSVTRAAGADMLTKDYTFNILEASNHIYNNVTFRFIVPTHTYGDPVWTWAEDYRSATAKFTCVDNDDTQTLDATVSSKVNPPTCTQAGSTVYTASVVFNSRTWTDKKQIPGDPATGHTYGDPVWAWADDDHAKATFTCEDCGDTQTVDATVEVLKRVPPTCTEDGYIADIATVVFQDKTWTDSKQRERSPDDVATGHDYTVLKWEWTADCSSATVKFTCVNCGDAQQVAATIDEPDIVPPTCTEDGSKTYVARARFQGKNYADTMTIVGDSATGHSYGEPTTWTWADDYTWATATFMCARGDDTQSVQTTDIAVETDPVDGKRYTASVTFRDKAYTNTVSQRKHTLTVNYVYESGEQVAEPHVGEVPEGSDYSVPSPSLTRLIPDVAVVAGRMGAEDVTVTVTYSDDTCLITSRINYNAKTNTAYQDVWRGEEATLNPCPFTEVISRTEYRFMGWNTRADGRGIAYADKAKIVLTEDLTLYAQWGQLFKLSFQKNGGRGQTIDSLLLVAGETVSLPRNTYTRDGYTFYGWNTDSDGYGKAYADGAKFVMPAAATKLYAQWKGKSATISFKHGEGGKGTMKKIPTRVGETVQLPKCTYTNGDLAFACWTTESDGTGDSYADGASIVVNATSIELYAQWEGRSATVTFIGGGGKGSMDPLTVRTVKTITLPECGFTRKSYAFIGWEDSAYEIHAPGDKIKVRNSMTLTASWEKMAKIVYNKNKGGITGEMDDQYVRVGDTVRLNANHFSRNGYKFIGWNTASNGTGEDYKDRASVTFTSSKTLKLYAQWALENPVELTLDTVDRIRKGKTLQLKATLMLNGKPVNGENVVFRVGSVKKSAKTNESGVATTLFSTSKLKYLAVGTRVVYSATYGTQTIARKAMVVE